MRAAPCPGLEDGDLGRAFALACQEGLFIRDDEEELFIKKAHMLVHVEQVEDLATCIFQPPREIVDEVRILSQF